MDIDFGTYHHSSPKKSEELRKKAGKVFNLLMKRIYSPETELKILDAGCGLGFLTSIALKTFPHSVVTAVDVFEHRSLSDATYERAMENFKQLGIESRVSLLTHDLTAPLDTEGHFDLAISNLVFHNLGKKRFLGYNTVFRSLKSGGYFIIGDLFPSIKKDIDYFNRYAKVESQEEEPDAGRWSYRVILLQKR